MKNIKQILIFITLIGLNYFTNSCRQDYKNSMILGEENARKELTFALNDTTHDKYIDSKNVLIRDKKTAINFAENVLFKIYGKNNITKQRPYEIYNFDNYWLISGTLPKGYLGGTFMFIVDSRDYRIISITHGK